MTITQTKTAPANTAIAMSWGISLTLAILSGFLIGASMPTLFDWGFLGWVGLIPLLIALNAQPPHRHFLVALPFGIVWSAMAHLWYPALFGIGMGIFLVVAVGAFYSDYSKIGKWWVNEQDWRQAAGILAGYAIPSARFSPRDRLFPAKAIRR
ncbi:MAG: hypothetical protein ACUVSW_17960, partial [Roseiflexus sp.]